MKINTTTSFVALLFLLSHNPAAAEDYTIVGSAWTCSSRGELTEIELRPQEHEISDDMIHRLEKAGCLPQVQSSPVNVIAFQGQFTFICMRLEDALGESFYCTYALTRELRGTNGTIVSNHFSKQSPSPHFFDGHQ